MSLAISNKQTLSYVTGCMSLGIFATSISLLLAVLTGIQFSESILGKLVMAAFGVLAVVGAHFLLALCRSASNGTRSLGVMIWLFCMGYLLYSHSSFFLLSQQQAGITRALSVTQAVSQFEPKRNLVAILLEEEKVKAEVLARSSTFCGDSCSQQKNKISRLNTRLEVLDAEAGDFKRWQAELDHQENLKDRLRDDPVTKRLASLLGMTEAQMGLVMGLLFSFILEGTACLCWYIVLQFRDSPLTPPVIESVTPISDMTITSNASDRSTLSELDIKIQGLAQEVRAGRLKLTVSNVRNYCRCSQERAAEIRKLMVGDLKVQPIEASV